MASEVGWHVRFERQFGPTTTVLFATEGILTARLQQDPLLTGFRTIILDEFHERSVHADLGIALAKEALRARADLRLVIMSATLDAAEVSAYLDGCPIVDVPGTLHPLEIRYAPAASLPDAVGTCLRERAGQVLCFLPGAGEIARARRELEPTIEERAAVEVVRASWVARRGGTGRGDCAHVAPAHHPGDEHRRNVADRSRRFRGRRRGAP